MVSSLETFVARMKPILYRLCVSSSSSSRTTRALCSFASRLVSEKDMNHRRLFDDATLRVASSIAMSDARAPEMGLHAFAGRVACAFLALTALMAWRLIIGVATLDIDAATMKMTQRFTGAPMKRAETRAVVTTMPLDAPTSSEPRRARREVKERGRVGARRRGGADERRGERRRVEGDDG